MTVDALTRHRMLLLVGVSLPPLEDRNQYVGYDEPEEDEEEFESDEDEELDDEDDDLEDEEPEEDEPAMARNRQLQMLGVELRARSNPAPGRQVIDADGARRYGLPIGATILPGMRKLTDAQQAAVAALPSDDRGRYLQSRRQGGTHVQSMKAARGDAPAAPRKAGKKAAPAKAAPAKKATPRKAAARPVHPELGEPLRRRTPMPGDVVVDDATGARGTVPRRGVIQWEGGQIERVAVPGKPTRGGFSLYAGDSAGAPESPADDSTGQARLARVQRGQGVAEVLSEVDELVDNQASPEALQSRIQGRVNTGAITQEQADRLIAAAAPDLTGARGLSSDPAVRQVQVENRIRQAYEQAPKLPGGGITLADLRDQLGESTPRDEVDATLRRMAREQGVSLMTNEARLPEYFPDREREASIVEPSTRGPDFGASYYAFLEINDATLRPIPTGRQQVDAAIAELATAAGLQRVTGPAGAVEPYDPARHTGIGSTDLRGKMVRVVRSGYSMPGESRQPWDTGTGPVVVHKATVEEATPDEAATAVAAQVVQRQAGTGLSALQQEGADEAQFIVDLDNKGQSARQLRALAESVGLEVPQRVRTQADFTLWLAGERNHPGLREAIAALTRPRQADFAPGFVSASDAAAVLAPLPDEASISARLAEMGLGVAKLRQLARELNIGIGNPSSGTRWTAAAMRDYIARVVVRDRGRFTWRNADPAIRSRALALLGVETRVAGEDTHPGGERLHHYWTRGEGLAKWRGSPHPFTTLVALLTKATDGKVPQERIKAWAASWVHEVTGNWPGSDAHRVATGHKPRGKRVGPG